MRRIECEPQHAKGALLARPLKAGGRKFGKGRELDDNVIKALVEAGVGNVSVCRAEPGDVLENAAANSAVKMMAGANVRVMPAVNGRAALSAEADGLVIYDPEKLERANHDHAQFLFAAQPPESPVRQGSSCASVKVVPLMVRSETAAAAARNAPVVAVRKFVPQIAALIQTAVKGCDMRIVAKTRKAVEARLAKFGSKLRLDLLSDPSRDSMAAALDKAKGCDLALLFGAHTATEPDDDAPAALTAAGGEIECFGVPYEPGHLLVVGRLGKTSVLIMPGTARSAQRGSQDVVLERLHAGLPADHGSLAGLGCGGLHPGPWSGGGPQPSRATRVAGVLLAAGMSRRMGSVNKLTAEHRGKPLVLHAAQVMQAARHAGLVRSCLAVTGCDADEIANILEPTGLATEHNPNFASGLASSLIRALDCLPAEVDGVLVMLGDMPDVTLDDIRAVVRNFDPDRERGLVAACHRGKRGNPVLISTRHFAELRALEGDVGARAIFAAHAVTEAAAGPGVLRDIDTPAQLRLTRNDG